MKKKQIIILIFLLLIAGLSVVSCSSTNKEKEFFVLPKEEAEDLLGLATNAFDRRLYSLSRELWTKLKDGYPGSKYVTVSELKIADCYFYNHEFNAALSAYEEFARVHAGHEAIEYVRFQIARSHEELYQSPTNDQTPLLTALKLYKAMLSNSPGSNYRAEYVVPAKRRIDECKEKLAKHELYVSEFYLKQEQIEPGLARLNSLIEAYPYTSAAKEAQAKLSNIDAQSSTPKKLKAESQKPTEIETKAPSRPRIVRLNKTGEQQLFKQTKVASMVFKEKDLDSSSQDKDVGKGAKADVSSQESGFIKSVSCNEIENKQLVILEFGAPYEVINLTKVSSTKISATIAPKNPIIGISLVNLLANLSCKTSSQQLTADLTNSANNNEQLMLNISIPENSVYNFINLDRPERLIITVK